MQKRLSELQHFSSTRIRCITAICPAGAPKLSAATLSHIQNASWIETPWLSALFCTCASMSGSNFTQGSVACRCWHRGTSDKNVIRQQPRPKLFRSSENMRESSKEVSSRAVASGTRSRGAVSAARTICAGFSRGPIERSHSASIVSNVHSSSRWPQNTP